MQYVPLISLSFLDVYGQHGLNNVSNCWDTKINFYLETSGSQSYSLYLYVVNLFNASVNYTSVAAEESCFPPLVSKHSVILVGNSKLGIFGRHTKFLVFTSTRLVFPLVRHF